MIEQELSRIRDVAYMVGVKLAVGIDKNAITIGYIGRDIHDSETKGNGKFIIQEIQKLADRSGYHVELSYHEETPELGKYYSSLGFVYDNTSETLIDMSYGRKP